MKLIKRYAAHFVIGGTGYGIIELIWRKHTHWTMILAGGICFIIFSVIAEKLATKPLAIKAVLASLCITLIELIFGVIFNIHFKMNVWDYSDIPMNILGQICPIFSFFWCILSFIFLPLASLLNEMIKNGAL